MTKKLFFLAFGLLCSLSVQAQQIEWEQLKAIQAPLVAPNHKAAAQGTKGGKRLAAHLFFFYKKYISSQDGMSCGFSPSCSEFAVESVKKYGSKGILMGADRLSRCNGISHKRYPLDSLSGLRLDAVPVHLP
jgi:putative component of membrane protein insertase Oxa1/YidC/SpoIIIJ protein YidD